MRSRIELGVMASIALVASGLSWTSVQAAVPSPAEATVSLEAGGLRLSLDAQGKVIELVAQAGGTNYRHATQASFLLSIQEYGKKNVIKPPVLKPVRLRVLSGDAQRTRVELGYEGGAVVTAELRICQAYLRMAVVDARSRVGVAAVHWGPYATSMEGPIAEWLGVNRSGTFSIGLLGLNPNTDGSHDESGLACVARWLPADVGGSELHAVSLDRSRDHDVLRPLPIRAHAVPNQTVIGSALALWGCEPAAELDVVEAIELGEGLPHPTLDRQWAKRSPRANGSAFWADYNESNIDQWIELANHAGIKLLCRYNPFGNWGHFEPDPKQFPHGLAGLRACAEKAAVAGIRTTAYTLSTFTRGFSLPEPYVTPVPDKRLQSYLPATTLAKRLDKTNTVIVLADGDAKLLAVFPANATKAPDKPKRALRIEDELIAYTIVRTNGGRVTLEDATRGFSGTTAVAHPAGTTAVRLCFYDGYDSFLPGTEDMNAEIACRIAEVVRTAKLGHVALDGVEETYSAGHDVFSMNSFLRVLYDHLLTDGITYLSSYMAQYGWHVYSSQSWGENDMERGFRGSQLELRLNNQIRLKRNHVPNKMGQYYPSSASLEDIEWLMGLAAGYDAGVDFVTGLPNNPDLYTTVRHWEQARQNGAFTEKQKMRLRQTDCLFTLVAKPDGGWEPRFVRRWQSNQSNSVASSSAPVKALTALTGQVAPCGIDFGWTHSPGICERSCITDDLVHTGGANASKFEVQTPWTMNEWGKKGLLCVVRVPAAARVAVRNPSLVIHWGGNLEHWCRLCFPVTLEPGQYLSMPHHIPVAYLYDSGHQLLKEIPLRDLPDFSCTRSQRLPVEISCEPAEPAGKSVVCVNLRFEESTLK